MRILVLIDGVHTKETFDELARLVHLDGAELLLAYVRSPGQRTSLELMRRRPGGHRPLPPHRERELIEAETAGGESAVAEAEAVSRGYGSSVTTIQISGEPGRAVCELAAREHAELIVVRAGGRDRPPIGPGSLGPTARFITDHGPAPVLLLRGR